MIPSNKKNSLPLIHPRFSSFVSSLSNGSSNVSSHQFSFSSNSSDILEPSSTSATSCSVPLSGRGLLNDSDESKIPSPTATSSSTSQKHSIEDKRQITSSTFHFVPFIQRLFIPIILLSPWIILILIFFGSSTKEIWILPTAISIGCMWALILAWFLFLQVSTSSSSSPHSTSSICFFNLTTTAISPSTPIHAHKSSLSVRFTTLKTLENNSENNIQKNRKRTTTTTSRNTNDIHDTTRDLPVSYRKADLMFRILSRPRSRSADDILWYQHALALHSAFGTDIDIDTGTNSTNMVTSTSRRFKSKFDTDTNANKTFGTIFINDLHDPASHPPRSSIFSPFSMSPVGSVSGSASNSLSGLAIGSTGLSRKSTLDLFHRPLAETKRRPATHYIDGKAHSRMESVAADAIQVSTDSSASASTSAESIMSHTRSASLSLPQRVMTSSVGGVRDGGLTTFGNYGNRFGIGSSLLRLPMFPSRSMTGIASGISGTTTTTGISSTERMVRGVGSSRLSTTHSSTQSMASLTSTTASSLQTPSRDDVKIRIDHHLGLDFHGILESPCIHSFDGQHSPDILVTELTDESLMSRDESVGY
jgi:hypothetical protein